MARLFHKNKFIFNWFISGKSFLSQLAKSNDLKRKVFHMDLSLLGVELVGVGPVALLLCPPLAPRTRVHARLQAPSPPAACTACTDSGYIVGRYFVNSRYCVDSTV